MGFNESEEYKKTFIFSGVGTGSMQVLHGFEFKVEPLGDHTFEVEPQENVDQGAGLQEVQTQDLIYYHLARDREQHLACELFGYREDINEAAFEVVVMCTCSATVAGNAVTTTMAINGSIHQGLLDKAKGNVLGMEVVKNHSGYTLRVSQSRFYNRIMYICGWKPGVSNGLHETWHSIDRCRSITRYGFMILGCAGSLKSNLQHMKALSTTEAGYMTFTEAWKKKMWLKGLLT
nr:zinc finger, CCHC-type [Tanacetum cinerariifolium]